MKCKYHLCDNDAGTVVGKRQRKFCSSSCRNKYFVDIHRKKLKYKAVIYKGGKCMKCGYDKCYGALSFHHRNPAEKSFNISQCHTRSWAKLKLEVDKCDILCCNCHFELENKDFEFKYDIVRGLLRDFTQDTCNGDDKVQTTTDNVSGSGN